MSALLPNNLNTNGTAEFVVRQFCKRAATVEQFIKPYFSVHSFSFFSSSVIVPGNSDDSTLQNLLSQSVFIVYYMAAEHLLSLSTQINWQMPTTHW